MINDQRPCFTFDFQPGVNSQNGRFHRFCSSDDVPDGYFVYHFDDYGLLRGASKGITQVQADMIDVAVAVYLADLRAPRPMTKSPQLSYCTGWARKMHIQLGVRLPALWRSTSVQTSLQRFLHRLTDDQWTFEFYRRSIPARASEIQSTLPKFSECASSAAILHSGGIDSLLGMIGHAASFSDHPLTGVSVISNSRHRAVQYSIIKELQKWSHSIRWKSIDLHFVNSSDDGDEREPSQRSRGFLYLAAGVIAAQLCGAEKLIVSENGVGAIALPYTYDQTGAMTNRLCHPQTLQIAEVYFGEALDGTIRIHNAALWHTKAERIRDVRLLYGSKLAHLIKETVSCDRFPRLPRDRPCGKCSSCIFRELALTLSNVVPGPYDALRSIPNANLPVGPLSFSNEAAFHAVRIQAERLRRVTESTESWYRLAREFPAILDIEVCAQYLRLTNVQLQEQVVSLLRRHVQEVDQFISQIHETDTIGSEIGFRSARGQRQIAS